MSPTSESAATPDSGADSNTTDANMARPTGAPASPAGSKEDRHPGVFRRLRLVFRRWMYNCTLKFRGRDTLDEALEVLNEQLGLVTDPDEYSLIGREPATVANPAAEYARTIIYAPDMDGQADTGEVVWIPVQLEGERKPVQERAIVVVGRRRHNVLLGALISSRIEHNSEPIWVFVGNSSWDREPKPSWVRYDRILEVPESGIRRCGAVMPRKRFDILATRLRNDYGWS